MRVKGVQGHAGICCVHLSEVKTNLKVHRDGGPGPFLLVVGRQQLDLSADLRLLHPSHAFDPTNSNSQALELSSLGFSSKKPHFKPLREN